MYTPNVDHVVGADSDDEFCEAYRTASLSLVDGQPLVWASWLLGAPLPEKISGSDLALPLLERAARAGWRVFLLGGAEGVAGELARDLAPRLGLRLVGAEAPRVSERGVPGEEEIARRVAATQAQLVLVALGSPKQELWIHRSRPLLGGAVCIGVGASLDFLAGRVRRAPRWISRAGLEWAYRLAQEPRRLFRRYLLKDPAIAGILLRTLLRRP